jgi:hypothetical protein
MLLTFSVEKPCRLRSGQGWHPEVMLPMLVYGAVYTTLTVASTALFSM